MSKEEKTHPNTVHSNLKELLERGAGIAEAMISVHGVQTMGEAVEVASGLINDAEEMSFNVRLVDRANNDTFVVHLADSDAFCWYGSLYCQPWTGFGPALTLSSEHQIQSDATPAQQTRSPLGGGRGSKIVETASRNTRNAEIDSG
jgi:hypothetical protein